MAIVINGSGTVTGLAVGGLPDGTVDSGTLASGIDKTSITDNGNATAITIDASENVFIGSNLKLRQDNTNDEISSAGNVLYVKATEFSFQTNSLTRLELTNDGRGLSQFTAKVWANFNGTGTPAFRDSHNCSSITDNGTGDYTINFSNNMGNTNFATVSNGGKFEADVVSDLHSINIGTQAVGSVRVGDNYANGGSVRDPAVCSLMVFGD